jgi:hypothetical protein
MQATRDTKADVLAAVKVARSCDSATTCLSSTFASAISVPRWPKPGLGFDCFRPIGACQVDVGRLEFMKIDPFDCLLPLTSPEQSFHDILDGRSSPNRPIGRVQQLARFARGLVGPWLLRPGNGHEGDAAFVTRIRHNPYANVL